MANCFNGMFTSTAVAVNATLIEGADATDTIRADLKDALENLSADQVAVIEEGSEILFTEVAGRAGDSWSEAIDKLANQIVKGLLDRLCLTLVALQPFARDAVER